MAVAISVPFRQMIDSGITEAVNEGSGPEATVKFKVAADDRYQFCRDIIGTTTRSGDTIVRERPYAYPPAPYLSAKSIPSIEPHGKPWPSSFFPLDGRWLYRQYSIVTVTFGIFPYNFDGSGPGEAGEPYTTVTFNSSGQIQTVPGAVYRFASGFPTTQAVGRFRPGLSISIKRYRLPYSPLAEIASLEGRVNVAPFMIAGYAFAAGTLLFSGGDSEIDVDSIGNVNINVSYKFEFQPVPWNYLPYPGRAGGFQVVTDGSGNSIYDPGNFALLP